MAARGKDGDGKVYTGPLPVTLGTRDFLCTRDCTHSSAHTTISTRNPPLTPCTHMQSEPSHISALPATDTHAHRHTCSHSPAALAPLPAPAQPQFPKSPSGPPPAQSQFLTRGQRAPPLRPQGSRVSSLWVCRTPVSACDLCRPGAWTGESNMSGHRHMPCSDPGC